MMRETRLVLPLPPSPNDWATHPMEQARQKNAYRRKVWIAALKQQRPMMHPPSMVVIAATFYLVNLRDEDNLTGSLKWLIDSLKQEQTGKVRWRQGVADRKGYFIDDDPEHLHISTVSQEIDRGDPRVEIALWWEEEDEAA